MKINRFKKLSLLIFILILGISVSACKQTENEQPKNPTTETPSESGTEAGEASVFTVEDDFGRTVTLEKAPERIISLAPSHTEILYALGLGDKIVGVTSLDDYPEEVLSVEKVGDFNGVNLEKVIELEPDLIINYGEGDPELNERLDEAGLVYVGFEPESIDQVIETIINIGTLTDRAAEAEKLTNEMSDHLNEISKKIKDAEVKTVFYEIWHEPLMAAGAGSFMDELITMAAGQNVATDADGAYPQYDLEQLIERNPQVYLSANDLPEKTAESIKARPGFENIDAIKNDRVHLLDGNIVSRPGPRIVQALELIARSIHPERFDKGM